MVKPKIYILGLDSATWDLIRPWVAEGKLPNLAKLITQGTSGPLESVIPPITPPAWTSFMTGKNPGKHGIFHFFEPEPGGYSMRATSAGSRRATTIWELLSAAGKTAGTINVPFTYPPEKLTGFQISGMDTPSEKSPFIHPPELRGELEQAVGPLRLELRYLSGMNTEEKHQQVLDEMEAVDRQWSKVGFYLLEKHPADVMMLTFMSVDTVQHHFWHFLDPNHFLHDPKGAEKFGKAIQNVYERLDQIVGEFISRLPEETTLFVVSDHGGGPVSDRVVYLNRYLAQLGLLKYRVGQGSALKTLQSKVTRKLYRFMRGALNSDQKKMISNLFPKLRSRADSAYTAFDNIDWSATKAYCSETAASPPSVWINRKGSKPQGIVEDSEYEPLVALLTEKLKELKDPRTGEAIIPAIYRRDEVYQGPHAGDSPDLLLDWWSKGRFASSPSFPEDGDKPPVFIRERQPIDMKEHEWGGDHRRDGILIAKGGPIRKDVQINGARLIDMAPTLLYLAGQKIPSDMDGRVLLDLFEPDFVAQNPVTYDQVDAQDQGGGTGPTYSAEDAALVEERLKALGYIE
ncbi:MAG: alkaline phosphatase family protein [Verrucomicrobia bacterium]|nr:alkaline phosphatase family protein [Verrucomicrobiota bacterium]